MVKLIVAIGPKGLIGDNNKMPWHISEEFKHFKETTMGHDLFMGRKTFESLPGKLPGRKHIVLSRNEVAGADVILHSDKEVNELFSQYKNSDKTLFIAGGKQIYEKFYKDADELIISEVVTDATGDTFLDLDLSSYKKEVIKSNPQFTVYKYTKR